MNKNGFMILAGLLGLGGTTLFLSNLNKINQKQDINEEQKQEQEHEHEQKQEQEQEQEDEPDYIPLKNCQNDHYHNHRDQNSDYNDSDHDRNDDDDDDDSHHDGSNEDKNNIDTITWKDALKFEPNHFDVDDICAKEFYALQNFRFCDQVNFDRAGDNVDSFLLLVQNQENGSIIWDENHSLNANIYYRAVRDHLDKMKETARLTLIENTEQRHNQLSQLLEHQNQDQNQNSISDRELENLENKHEKGKSIVIEICKISDNIVNRLDQYLHYLNSLKDNNNNNNHIHHNDGDNGDVITEEDPNNYNNDNSDNYEYNDNEIDQIISNLKPSIDFGDDITNSYYTE